jgi:DNA (cytosine-5)-methyltransferase 1
MIKNELKTGPWDLADLKDVKQLGKTVFSCFCCGGGSTMGYKLAGFEVLGGVEIDPEMAKIYIKNHNPKHMFRMGVQDFKNIPNEELPAELFDLDILDGSPPCSSFSMAGSREKKWGKKKKFREGQAEQVLDDLFFDFIDVAKKLQPKVVVAENVKGLIQGNARGYVKEIFAGFKEAGYSVQLFLLNASRMGVPQRRERTFFIANRLGKKIALDFDEKPIRFKDAIKDCRKFDENLEISPNALKYYDKCDVGKSFASVHPKGSLFNYIKIDIDLPINTLASGCANIFYHPNERRILSTGEWIRGQSFPDDFKHVSKYLIGMSVPPFMAQRVATEIYRQLLV